MKLYTKVGDEGVSSLYNGQKRSKDDLVFEALGSIDELAAHIGLLTHHTCFERDFLINTMSRLLDIGSSIATPLEDSTTKKIERVFIDLKPEILVIESKIDEFTNKCPVLTNFILPFSSNSVAACQCHVVRTITRRAERRVVAIKDSLQNKDILVYLNRLSDYFFAFSRFLNLSEEFVYKKQ